MNETLDYSTENENLFFSTLKSRVEGYFEAKDLPISGSNTTKTKAFLLILFFFIIYAGILYSGNTPFIHISLWIAFGIIHALIPINIGHDALHDALFESKVMNRIFSYSWNLIGTNEYVWKITHNDVHHLYPNVPDVDPDIDQTPLLRMSPKAELKWFHRYQHLYAPIIYLMFGFYLVFIKDFRIFFFLKKIGLRENNFHPLREYIILIVTKAAYIFALCYLPYSFSGNIFLSLTGFFIMLGVESIIVTMVTAPAHIFDSSKYMSPNRSGVIESDWAVYQMATTSDFARNVKWFKPISGGSNQQNIHHLFPNICHSHFEELTKILEQTAREFKVNYIHHDFWELIKSHHALLKKLGSKE